MVHLLDGAPGDFRIAATFEYFRAISGSQYLKSGM